MPALFTAWDSYERHLKWTDELVALGKGWRFSPVARSIAASETAVDWLASSGASRAPEARARIASRDGTERLVPLGTGMNAE